jgi:hypothetical protein
MYSTRYSRQILMKILPVGAKLYHADSETDGPRNGHDETNSRFSRLCKLA